MAPHSLPSVRSSTSLPSKPPHDADALRICDSVRIGVRDERKLVRELTPTEQSTIESRIATLNAALAPCRPTDRTAAGAAIANMLAVFPSLRAQGEDAQALVLAYTQLVGEFPLWAITEVCRKFASGRIKSDPRFPPTGPELCIAIRAVIAPHQTEQWKMERILSAPVEECISSDELARRRALVDAVMRP